MRSLRLFLAAASIAAVTQITDYAHAGPTVLRDDQLRDLAVTPALGRGYSLATNTFQSICLTGFKTTKPSYNFDYRFDSIDTSGSSTSNTTIGGAANFSGGIFGASVRIKGSAEKTTINGKEYTSHYILVTTNVDIYYSSVDESNAQMSGPATDLLQSRDIPGFFDACGLYYVRSIGRRATFLSVFEYKTEKTTRDESFEAKLEAQIKGWGRSGGFNASVSKKFNEEASSKYLTITSVARGLGKNENASLIAYDLETFRAALKDAFVSMQEEDTGMVTSIEVVPWVENAEFQRILRLQESTQTDEESGEVISPYAQKRILNLNGEFLAEIDRSARAKLNVYYKAKQCRARIDLDYKDGDNLRDEFADAKVINHRTGAQEPLSTLDQQVNSENIQALFSAHKTFLFGDDNGNGGAVACVRDLSAAGLTVKPYREIESCAAVEQELGVISGQAVDEYCMPTLAPKPANQGQQNQ